MAALKKFSIVHVAAAGFIVVAGWGNTPSRAQVVSAAEDPSLVSPPAVVMASPTTMPSDPTPAMPDAGRDDNRGGGFSRGQGWFGGGPGGFGGGHGGQSNLADIPDGSEWKQISSFMVDHSPHRWAYYNRLPDGPRQQGMMHVITRSFRSIQKAQTDDPNLGAVIVQRIEAEDAVFGVVMDIRQARRGRDSEKARSFTDELTAKVTALVDISFKERQLRVDTLQKALDSLKTHLATDQKNRDQVIAARVQTLTNQHMGPPGLGDASIASPVEPNDAPRAVSVDFIAK